MIARHGPLDLLLFAANGNDQPRIAFMAASLYQYGSFRNGNATWSALRKRGRQSLFTGPDGGMDQSIQFLQTLWISEDLRRQKPAIDGAVRIQNLRAEFAHDALVCFGPRRHHEMAEFIRLNQQASQIRKRMSDETFPGGEPSGEPDAQNSWRFAT